MKKLRLFRREKTPETGAEKKSWKVLVVDDEQLVHDVTHMVLSRIKFEGRPIELASRYSKHSAQEYLSVNDDVALAIIDVVMETDHAGLELIEWIRNTSNNHSTRIILRTGQAGIAPEEEIITNYDINDYKNKTELTSTKLVTTVLSCIRSYRDIKTIERSLDGLKSVMESSSAILKPGRISDFGSAVLNQLLSLLDIDSSSIYITNQQINIYGDKQQTVLGATGSYSGIVGSLEELTISPTVKKLIQDAFLKERSFISNEYYVSYYKTDTSNTSVLYIELTQPLNSFKQGLLELFCSNVALVFENLKAKEEVLSVQSELMMIIGDAIEMRSKETGFHVKRVSELCRLLAKKAGTSISFQEYIGYASPLHDLGKIAIPERILEKPGNLNDEEWAIMRTHSEIGATLLQKSHRTVAKMGERIARHHHENWDGTGYPDGISGEEIPLEARIAAVADVFDALASKRSYKTPWSLEKIIDHFSEQAGKKFDPKLVKVLLDNIEEFQDSRLILKKRE